MMQPRLTGSCSPSSGCGALRTLNRSSGEGIRGYPYIRPQMLPQGTVTAAGRGHILRATARRR